MEPTLEQYKQLYAISCRLTRQLRWHIRWIEQVPGGEVVVVAQPPNATQNDRRRIVITITSDGRIRYGNT